MFGKSKREPPDMSTRRSLEIVAGADDMDARELVTDYFYHGGDFWRAVIPLDATEEVFGQAFNFSRPVTRKGKDGPEVVYDKRGQPKPRFSAINHLQSRFRLKQDRRIRLYPLGSDFAGEPVHNIDDFVYSVEAVGPTGMAFDFRNGMSGRLTCAHRFLSTEEMVFERVVVQGQYVWQSAPLPLTDTERRAVLHKSLLRSDRARMTEPYYLYRCCGTNNCTSNPFQIVDGVVKYTWRQKLGSLAYRLPLSPRFYLWVRGLDADPEHYRLVREDFVDFIELPETQSRKREVVRAAIRQRREAQGRPRKRRT